MAVGMSTGNWWSRAECTNCASVTNDNAQVSQTTIHEKIAVLEKTLAGKGNDEPILAGKRVLEKEFEKHQKKLEAHRGQAKLDQQGIQTHRDRERKAGGDAGETSEFGKKL